MIIEWLDANVDKLCPVAAGAHHSDGRPPVRLSEHFALAWLPVRRSHDFDHVLFPALEHPPLLAAPAVICDWSLRWRASASYHVCAVPIASPRLRTLLRRELSKDDAFAAALAQLQALVRLPPCLMYLHRCIGCFNLYS